MLCGVKIIIIIVISMSNQTQLKHTCLDRKPDRNKERNHKTHTHKLNKDMQLTISIELQLTALC